MTRDPTPEPIRQHQQSPYHDTRRKSNPTIEVVEEVVQTPFNLVSVDAGKYEGKIQDNHHNHNDPAYTEETRQPRRGSHKSLQESNVRSAHSASEVSDTSTRVQTGGVRRRSSQQKQKIRKDKKRKSRLQLVEAEVVKLDRHDQRNNDLPIPYWEEKMFKNHAIFAELREIEGMEKLLKENIFVAEELMKHPHIAANIVKDHKLAHQIMERPSLLRELIIAKTMIEEREKQAAARVKKKSSVLEGLPSVKWRRSLVSPEGEIIKGRQGPASVTTTGTSLSSAVSMISRATLPVDVEIPEGLPMSLKYVAAANRLFLRHHREIWDGPTVLGDKKRDYYDIMDAYGSLFFRAYEGNNSFWSKATTIAIRDPDGTDVIIFKKRWRLCSKKLLIHCPPGLYEGYVEKSGSTYRVHNRNSDETLIIRISKASLRKKYSTEFELRTVGDNSVVGRITGEWLDLPPGVYPTNRIYGVTFPKELGIHAKLGVMAAWFLIYKYHFEGSMGHDERRDLSESEEDLEAYINEESTTVSQITHANSSAPTF